MVGRRGEAPLVPPYTFRSPNKAMALHSSCGRGCLSVVAVSSRPTPTRRVSKDWDRTALLTRRVGVGRSQHAPSHTTDLSIHV